MAITQVSVKRQWGVSGSLDAFKELVTAVNLLATKLDAVCAKLDADVGVTDTNYRALHGDVNLSQISTIEAGD